MNLIQLLRKFKHPNSIHKMKGNQVAWRKNIQMRFYSEDDRILIMYKVNNKKTHIHKNYEINLYKDDPIVYVEINNYHKRNQATFKESDIISNSLLEISTDNTEESLFQTSLIYDLFEIDVNSVNLLNDLKNIYFKEEYGFKRD